MNICGIALPLLVLAGLIHGQDVSYTGTVTGYANVPLQGVSVQLTSGGPSTLTDGNGQFTLTKSISRLQSPRQAISSLRFTRDAIQFFSTHPQSVSLEIFNVSGERVASTGYLKIGSGNQTLSLPHFTDNLGVFSIQLNANGRSSALRYINMESGGISSWTGESALAARDMAAARKKSAAADSLIYMFAGYQVGKQAISDSALDYPIRLIKDGAVERVGYIGGGANGKGSIFSTLMDGTDERGFETPALVLELAWSADGRKVAFATGEGENAANHFNRAIYVCDYDGSNMKLLTHGLHPAWHPNGDWLAWVTNGKSDGNFTAQVWMANLAADAAIPVSAQLSPVIFIGPSFPYEENVTKIFFYPHPQPKIAIEKFTLFFKRNALDSLVPFPRHSIQKGEELSNNTGNFFALTTIKAGTTGEDRTFAFVGLNYDGGLMYWEEDMLMPDSSDGITSILPRTLHAGIFSRSYTWNIHDLNTPYPLEMEQMGGIFSPNSFRCLMTGWEDRTYKYLGVFSQDPNGENRIRLPGLRSNPTAWFLANW